MKEIHGTASLWMCTQLLRDSGAAIVLALVQGQRTNEEWPQKAMLGTLDITWLLWNLREGRRVALIIIHHQSICGFYFGRREQTAKAITWSNSSMVLFILDRSFQGTAKVQGILCPSLGKWSCRIVIRSTKSASLPPLRWPCTVAAEPHGRSLHQPPGQRSSSFTSWSFKFRNISSLCCHVIFATQQGVSVCVCACVVLHGCVCSTPISLLTSISPYLSLSIYLYLSPPIRRITPYPIFFFLLKFKALQALRNNYCMKACDSRQQLRSGRQQSSNLISS